jgi:hypothetical protein
VKIDENMDFSIRLLGDMVEAMVYREEPIMYWLEPREIQLSTWIFSMLQIPQVLHHQGQVWSFPEQQHKINFHFSRVVLMEKYLNGMNRTVNGLAPPMRERNMQ